MSVVAAAVIGSAVVGYAGTKKAAKSADKSTAAQSAAADETAQLGRDRLAFEKQQYEDGRGVRDEASQIAIDTARAQLESQREQDALAAEYAEYSKNTFRPLEQSIVTDAQGYDTPERRNAEAAAAMADVNKGFAATGAARARMLAAEGIDPGSTRSMAAMGGQDTEHALGNASAAYKARQGVEATGFARKMDAASLGRGLASNQATSAQLALSAGNSAVGNAQVPVGIQQQSGAGIGAGYNSAINAQAQAGNLYGNIANRAAQSDNSGALWGALGNVAGQWAGSEAGSSAIAKWISSDENLKTDIEPQNPDEALAEVTATPVSNWKYDPAKMAARGIEIAPGHEGKHTGPMAQDVQATMGKEASNGERINPNNIMGKTMLAVQALDKKVNKLASMIGSGQIEATRG